MAMEGLKGTFYADGADADAEKTWRHMPWKCGLWRWTFWQYHKGIIYEIEKLKKTIIICTFVINNPFIYSEATSRDLWSHSVSNFWISYGQKCWGHQLCILYHVAKKSSNTVQIFEWYILFYVTNSSIFERLDLGFGHSVDKL